MAFKPSVSDCSESILEVSEGCFRTGSFEINLEKVNISDLKIIRKLLPKTEYKLLKGRKCARMGRSRKKDEILTLE